MLRDLGSALIGGVSIAVMILIQVSLAAGTGWLGWTYLHPVVGVVGGIVVVIALTPVILMLSYEIGHQLWT